MGLCKITQFGKLKMILQTNWTEHVIKFKMIMNYIILTFGTMNIK